jgi:hypothetical protein
MHRCEFCKILLSYAKVCKIIQIFASICRRDTDYQRVHWGRRWQDGRDSRSFSPEHSETFQSISKHFVTSRCHSLGFVAELTGPLASADDLKRSLVSPAVDRLSTAGGWTKLKLPSLISMAARCAHAGPTSRRARQSRLPDREAARRRRGLDGRRAVVTRI